MDEIIDLYKKYFEKYFDFEGRANIKEYWIPALINFVIMIILLNTVTILGRIFGLLTFIPSIAISVRRLHDINKSGWLLLIGVIPFVGALVVFILMLQPSVYEGNKYGDNAIESEVIESVEEPTNDNDDSKE